MRRVARSSLSVGLAVLLAATAPESATAQDQDEAAAEALFKAGRALVQAGEIEAGCKKLEQSYEVGPSLGTLLNIADCQERAGRTASAWLAFRKAANQARIASDAAREDMARRRAASIEPNLCMLTIGASHPPPPPDLIVARDGATVVARALGVPTPIDPGEHRVRFTRGARTEERHVEARPVEGSGCPATSVGLPDWALAPSAPPQPMAPTRVQREPLAAPLPLADDRGGFGAHHAVAVATFGAGAIVTGIGIGFGVDAITTQNRAEDLCTTRGCTRAGLAALGDAGASADASTVLFAVGGGLLVTGVVLWLTSPSLAAEPAPQGALLRF